LRRAIGERERLNAPAVPPWVLFVAVPTQAVICQGVDARHQICVAKMNAESRESLAFVCA